MNFKVATDLDTYRANDPKHIMLDKHSSLLKLNLSNLRLKDVLLIEPFLKKFSNKQAWLEYIKKVKADPKNLDHYSQTEKIKTLMNKFSTFKKFFLELSSIPSDVTLFAEDKRALAHLRSFTKLYEYRHIIQALKNLPAIHKILNQLEQVRQDAIEEHTKIRNVVSYSNARTIAERDAIKKRVDNLNNLAASLERDLIHKLDHGFVNKQGPQVIMDVGNKYYHWLNNQRATQLLLGKSIKEHEKEIAHFERFIKILESGNVPLLKRIYGKEALWKVDLVTSTMDRYKADVLKMQNTNNKIENLITHKIERMNSYNSSKKSIRDSFISGRGVYSNFDEAGYNRYIIQMYKRIFRPGSSVQVTHGKDESSSYVRIVNFRYSNNKRIYSMESTSLGELRIPMSYLREIKEHFEYLDEVESRYDDILDFRDRANQRVSISGVGVNFNGGTPEQIRRFESSRLRNGIPNYNVSLNIKYKTMLDSNSPVREGKRGTEFQNPRSHFKQDKMGNVYKIDYEAMFDKEANLRHQRSHFFKFGKAFFGFDTAARLDPRWKPTGPVWFSFGRVHNPGDNVDNEHNRIMRRLEEWNAKDPIAPRWIHNQKTGQYAYLSAETIFQRRYNYIYNQAYRKDDQGNNLLNTKGPWKAYITIDNKINRISHPDQIASVAMEIYHNFHRSSVKGADLDIERLERNPKSLTPGANTLGPEALDLLAKLRKRAFLLNDPSMESLDDIDMEKHLENPFSLRYWAAHIIRERRINGWVAQIEAHEENERVGSTMMKKNQEQATTRFNNDERFVAVRMKGYDVKVHNLGDSEPYVDLGGRYRIARRFKEHD